MKIYYQIRKLFKRAKIYKNIQEKVPNCERKRSKKIKNSNSDENKIITYARQKLV